MGCVLQLLAVALLLVSNIGCVVVCFQVYSRVVAQHGSARGVREIKSERSLYAWTIYPGPRQLCQ